MAQRPLGRVSLIDSLVEQLEAQIVARDFPVGSRLPAEEELATQFEVSRPVIREGLSRLRERGFLETINGRGTFIRHPGADHLAASLLRQIRIESPEGYNADNLYEARGAIELTTARLAAERADQKDIARLRSHLNDMMRFRNDPSAYTTADVSFHIDVANASGNPFLGALLQPLATIIIEGILESSQTRPEAVDDGVRMHTELLDCIERRDPEGAARAMDAHLHDSRRSFPGGVLNRLG